MKLEVVSTEIRLVRIETAIAMVQSAAERIEAKLDRLLAALAEDNQDDEHGLDLDGAPLGAARDPDEPL